MSERLLPCGQLEPGERALVLADRIAHWNQELLRAHVVGKVVSSDRRETIATDLDSFWRNHNELCWVGGLGQQTSIDATGKPVPRGIAVDAAQMISRGFQIVRFRQATNQLEVAFAFCSDLCSFQQGNADVMMHPKWTAVVPTEAIDLAYPLVTYQHLGQTAVQ